MQDRPNKPSRHDPTCIRKRRQHGALRCRAEGAQRRRDPQADDPVVLAGSRDRALRRNQRAFSAQAAGDDLEGPHTPQEQHRQQAEHVPLNDASPLVGALNNMMPTPPNATNANTGL